MSRVLRIDQGGYKIITAPSSEILLDTGVSGQVRITGDLIVEGEQTKLEVSVLEVEDRIVVINRFPPGGAASQYTGIFPITDQYGSNKKESGIEIQRGGGASKIRFLFDENVQYTIPGTNTIEGMFVFRDTSNQQIGISTDYIKTQDKPLYLDVGTGLNSVISVKTTTPGIPYHLRLLQNGRDNNNDIPNVRFIKEYVRAEAGAAIIEQFFRYAIDEDGAIKDTKTGAKAKDTLAGDQYSGIFFSVGEGSLSNRQTAGYEGKEVASFDLNGLFIGVRDQQNSLPHMKLYITGSIPTISTDNSNLAIAPETGVIKLRNTVHVEHLPDNQANPNPLFNNNILYSRNDQGAGGTGLYFANTVTAGEICSAAKALVYGLIF